jgi:exodeoxyribonuclease VII small subunit
VGILTQNTGLKDSIKPETHYMVVKKKTFEESLKELEKIVTKLEAGEISLEESLVQFEQGTKLYKECKNQLNIAEKKIAIITESLKEEEIL